MDKPEPENGGRVESIAVPVLTITFDPRTYTVEVGGSVPNWIFAKAMLQMAADEAERKIQAARIQAGIAIAGPELLESLKGRGA